MKAFPTEALTHTPISATLALVLDNDLRPDDIQEVHVRSLARAADILADPSKYEPDSKETADHSLPYCLAAAVVDRKVTPEQFEEAKIHDPAIRAQLRKVKVVADPEIEAVFPDKQRCVVRITTTDDRSFEKALDFPKGDPRNPMTDREIEEKFDALAAGVADAETAAAMKESLWETEDYDDLSDLMSRLVGDEA
jgi:2-methylcitrate dehydratase